MLSCFSMYSLPTRLPLSDVQLLVMFYHKHCIDVFLFNIMLFAFIFIFIPHRSFIFELYLQ